MRRTILVALVVGLVVAGAAPVAARDINNSSQTMVQMWGSWSSYDEETGVFVDAGIYATDYADETWVEYYRFSGTPITCEGDVPGFLYESFWGSGPGTMDHPRNYTTGSVNGTVTGWMETYMECYVDGEIVVPENGGSGHEATFEVSAVFTSTSPLIREKSSSSFKIPGEVNSHYSVSSVYRTGDLVADIDGATFEGYGQLGKVSWKSHSNSK